MSINNIEFSKLERELLKTRKSPIDYLAPEIGKVYVVAITRDGCSACERQKTKLNKVATTISKKHGDKVVFTRIHVKLPKGSNEESLRCKDMFGHYFYPTNLILLRTADRGAIEYYKNVSPDMNELKRNIETTLEVATTIEKETA
ncbi:MAG: hypothetical protein ACE5KD_01625 [Candidatus Bathyarchaeia archaeon]